MPTLDKVIEMQQRGLPDSEISLQLQNEGVPPHEIQDSLNQARVKHAVSPPEQQPLTAEAPAPIEGMQASMMQSPEQPPLPTEPPMPEQPPPQTAPAPEIYPPQNGQSQDQYYQETPQAYSGQEYYPQQEAMSTDIISEIAEQVVIEKLEAFRKKTGDISSFKITIQDKVANIDERLKRIEASIDKLQQAVIGKIGELGENNSMIHKDLDNLHNTVSKLMNPLIDNYNELTKR